METNNLWHDPKVAESFKDQHFARPYIEMMKVFDSLLPSRPVGKWLDLGCGAGEISKLVWKKSLGKVEIAGLDCNPGNRAIFLANISQLNPSPPMNLFTFNIGDICEPLPFECERFDGVVSGLCLSYAEHHDGQNWTDQAYLRIYAELYRVIKPGGELIFSTNVPNPNFTKIMTSSWRELIFGGMFFRLMRNGLAMVRFSQWLKECASIGRFHYPPIERVVEILVDTGFKDIQYELTYANQAWVVRCRR